MAVEVVRSVVELDHLYARQDDEALLDLSKDVNLSEAIDSLAELSESDLLSLFFGDNDSKIEDTSLSSFDEFDLSPSSESTSSESYMTPSPETMDFDSLSSPEGLSADDFAINVDLDGWLSTLDEGVVPVSETPVQQPYTTTSQSTSIEILNEPIVSSTSTPIETRPAYRQTYKKTGLPLVLSTEEKRLLAEEGAAIPTDVALTKAEERTLKKVRRKIKNKQSAQESRRKKKDYMDGLEKRVQVCTEQNRSLQKKVDQLENNNNSLLTQLKQLQAIVSSTHPSKTQAGTCLMVLILAFGLVVFPLSNNKDHQSPSVSSYATTSVRSRTLLQVKDDYMSVQDETVNTPKLNPNGSDVYLPQAIELDWNQGEYKETLTDLATDLSNGEDKENVHPDKVMRTEKR
ncbi:hypothetical protein QZH41_011105 [Actinostola sp. cb2023]|nr:hypothetical protein QZH41_011105 [Actinostola sp. cb2023]